MSCIEKKIDLSSAAYLCIEYALNTNKAISFGIKDEEGEVVELNTEYSFCVSTDANKEEILLSLSVGNGIEIAENELFVNIYLDKYVEPGKKFFELKDLSINETLVSGEFLINETLIK